MNAKTTRILKEARPLLWPWCAVATAGVLPLVQPLHSIADISSIGFFLGIPLLATLSLGNEFQHRTLSLLLTQPVDRMEIWGEKLSVTVVAVLSAALVCFFGWRVAGLLPDPRELVVAGAYIIATIAAATFWTLVARSTLGALVLNFLFPSFMIIVWANLPERIRETGHPFLPATNTGVSIAAFFFLCYAGVMLWLGRRMLARFQVTGGMAGDDLLMAGPNVMPGALVGWFRCRPTGAFLNLIRKEFRLLRPLWLITQLEVLGWICLTMFRFVPERGSTRNLPVAVVMVGAFSIPGAALYIDRDSRRKPVARGGKNVRDTLLAHDPAGAGPPPVAHQACYGHLYWCRLRGAASNLGANRWWIDLRIALQVCGSPCRNGLAAHGVTPGLCLILVCVCGRWDRAGGAVAFSNDGRPPSRWSIRRLGCARTDGLRCFEVRSLRRFQVHQLNFKHLVRPDVALRGDAKLPPVSGTAPGQRYVRDPLSTASGHRGIPVQLFSSSIRCLRGSRQATDV